MLEKNSPKPLYQQLKDILVDAIDSEKWKANEKIPSENELRYQKAYILIF